MAGRLAGKFAIVTGGGRGIGRAICNVFSREGASVAVVEVSKESGEETMKMLPRNHGNKHCVIYADVSNANDATRAVKEAENQLGQKCTIMVNNAGILRANYFVNMTEKDFDDVIQVNLKGAFLMAKELLKSVKDSDAEVRGKLINMCSLGAKIPFPMNANYTAAKAGVVGLTRTIAAEFGTHKVLCNCVLPGFTDTPMLDDVDPGIQQVIAQNIPLGRYGRPEEIANVSLFLASEESSYMHGACVEVGGGLGA